MINAKETNQEFHQCSESRRNLRERERERSSPAWLVYLLLFILIPWAAYADETCGNDYTLASTGDIADYSMIITRAGDCDPGYQAYVLSYDVAFPVSRDLPMNCGAGYYYNNGSCVAYQTGPCDSGFFDNAQNSGTMFDYAYVGGCTGGMEPIQTSHSAVRLVDTVADSLHCGAGYYYKNGSCVAYERGGCEENYVNETAAVQDSTFDTTYIGSCIGGYDEILGRHDAMYVIFSTSNKCGAGEYPTPTGCVSYSTENCPENYYAVGPLTAFTRADDNDECASNYSLFQDTDLCRQYLGANMSEICTPQLVCAAGGTRLRTATGISIPIYGERATTPSLNIGFSNGDVCHMNMVSGSASGAININYNNTVYHVAN